MNLPVEVLEAVRAKRCVCFLGSRAAFEAAQLAGADYPDAAALAKELGWRRPAPVPGQRPKPTSPSVEEGAATFEAKHGRAALEARLAERVGAPFAPPPFYEKLLARFPLVVTTCWDDLLERAGASTVTGRGEPIPNEGVVRLRGRLGDRPVVTAADFAAQPLSPDQKKQLRALIRNQVVLFVGYRPDEEEFERLFGELSDAYGGELPRSHLAAAQGPIDDYQWQKWVWRGLLLFLADPSEVVGELEAKL
ncbi:MAG: SIR2 family protein [Myxococcota bacterium]